MNLMEETLLMLKSRGNEAAIINQEGFILSFSDFHDQTTKLAYLLLQSGVQKGSRVVVLANLDWPLYCAIAAVFQLGGIIVLVDPWASSDYIQKALSQVNPDFLIISKKARFFYLKKSIRQIAKRLILDDLISHATMERHSTVTHVDPEHTALITFTSGSTGKPKGFDRSHLFLLSQQRAHDKFFDHHEGEIDLSMYPVFVLSNLKSGMTSVLVKGNLRKIETLNPADLYGQLTSYQVDSLSVSPVILEKLIVHCEKERLPLPLKKVFTGGAPVRRDICERLLKLNPLIKGYVVYGSTEAEPMALVSMQEVVHSSDDIRVGTPLGRVVSDLKYDLLKPAGKIHPYHQGEVGEVTLSGDFVGQRYWNNEEAFKENKWTDDSGNIWHKTGDMVIRKDEFLYMIGRRSSPITTSEGDLFPIPLENQIDQMPEVKKAAYLKHEDKIILAFEGLSEAKGKIKKFFLSESLPIDEIIQIEEMPMDARHRSKIDLPKLKEYLQEGKIMVSHESPLFSRILAYTKERFPLIPILLFVFLLTSGYGHFLANWLGSDFSWKSKELWWTMVAVFMFMLQLRMSDEIKDFEKDKMAYPQRILSQGIIGLNLVRVVLYITIFLEIIISALIGQDALIMMAILQIWAFLMSKEFFCKEFLEPKVSLYLITHQLILPPLAIYSALPFISLNQIFHVSIIWPLLYLSLTYTTYELARKTWSSDRENPHADSYTKFWGIKGAVWAQMGLIAAILILLGGMTYNFLPSYLIGTIILSLIYITTLLAFQKSPTRKMSKMVEAGGSLFLLGMCALNAFLLG